MTRVVAAGDNLKRLPESWQAIKFQVVKVPPSNFTEMWVSEICILPSSQHYRADYFLSVHHTVWVFLIFPHPWHARSIFLPHLFSNTLFFSASLFSSSLPSFLSAVKGSNLPCMWGIRSPSVCINLHRAAEFESFKLKSQLSACMFKLIDTL